VLIDSKARVLYVHGPTSDYLELPQGEPTRDLLSMARDGLRPGLRHAVRQAIDNNQAIKFRAQVHQGQTRREVSATVAPVAAGRPSAALLLVTFEAAAKAGSAASSEEGSREAGESTASLHGLEDELKATRAEYRNTVEQMETGNEELKAANEEITSINEELQSTNEELETSKEELQSYNEELHTINYQLQHKVKELENLADDQNNLLAGTEVATLFLDNNYCIKWFSPASRALLNLVASDIGRPLAHFAPKFDDANLLDDMRTVLEKLTHVELEVRSSAGRWYLRRLIPYRTQDNRIAGIVLTFTDITERKLAADAVNDERFYAQAIVETIKQPLLVLDANLRVQSGNSAFFRLFKVAPEVTLNERVYDLGNRQWNIPRLRQLLEDILPGSQVIEDFVVEHDFETIGKRTMLLNARKILRGGGRPELILLAIDDITARAEAEAHRNILIAEMSHRVKNVLATVQSIGSQTLRQSHSLEDFKTAFNGRLLALARAHDLLINEGWAGAKIAVLVNRTLAPYRTGEDRRITTDGPRIILRPQAGVALIMILHELATNAAKYGALSVPNGTLSVTWRRGDGDSDPRLRLDWIEVGGPRVKPPSHRGFGSNLVERSTAHELHGRATLDYREEGLRVELVFPLEELHRLDSDKEA
jgi:two-component system CheB/CheR fusion protein